MPNQQCASTSVSETGDESSISSPVHPFSRWRKQGRELASRDLGIALELCSSRTSVARVLGVSKQTVHSWCDTSTRKSISIGDIYALALHGHVETARQILATMVVSINAIEQTRARDRSSTEAVLEEFKREIDSSVQRAKALIDAYLSPNKNGETP